VRSFSSSALLLIVVSGVLTAAANLLLRHGLVRAGGFDVTRLGVVDTAGALLRQPTFVAGVILYGAAAVVWFRVLSVAEVSTSYPILIGLTFVLVSIGAVAWFQESMSVVKAAGIAVILAGIVLVGRA
jgi:multidrug transporter EmrE-like cation transporter